MKIHFMGASKMYVVLFVVTLIIKIVDNNKLFYRNPYEERTAHAYHVYSSTGHGSWSRGYSGMVT